MKYKGTLCTIFSIFSVNLILKYIYIYIVSPKSYCADLWTQWGKEKVGQTESSTEIYTLPCVKLIATGKFLYSARSSAWCSVTA